MRWYPVVFWLLWTGVPAAVVGCRYRSWSRAAAMAGATLVVPFLVSLTLLLAGPPGMPDLETWESFSVDVGVPSGYVLGIALTLALFRQRDRARRSEREQEPEALAAGDPRETAA